MEEIHMSDPVPPSDGPQIEPSGVTSPTGGPVSGEKPVVPQEAEAKPLPPGPVTAEEIDKGAEQQIAQFRAEEKAGKKTPEDVQEGVQAVESHRSMFQAAIETENPASVGRVIDQAKNIGISKQELQLHLQGLGLPEDRINQIMAQAADLKDGPVEQPELNDVQKQVATDVSASESELKRSIEDLQGGKQIDPQLLEQQIRQATAAQTKAHEPELGDTEIKKHHFRDIAFGLGIWILIATIWFYKTVGGAGQGRR
jgi:hypothetical protein